MISISGFGYLNQKWMYKDQNYCYLFVRKYFIFCLNNDFSDCVINSIVCLCLLIAYATHLSTSNRICYCSNCIMVERIIYRNALMFRYNKISILVIDFRLLNVETITMKDDSWRIYIIDPILNVAKFIDWYTNILNWSNICILNV